MKARKRITACLTALFTFCLVLAGIFLITPMKAEAAENDTFTVDNITYKVLTEREESYTVAVSGHTLTEETSVTIPATVSNGTNSYSVVQIQASAFASCEYLTEIVFPEGFAIIGDSAFQGCTALKRITVPSTLKRIGDSAFRNASVLTEVCIADLNAWYNIDYGSQFGVPFYASQGGNVYLDGKPITSVTLPEGMTEIKRFTFYGWQCLESITIPSSLKTIGTYAFRFADNLKDVYLSDLDAWYGIDFANDRATPTHSADNVYLNGSPITSVVIPDSITKIKPYTFYGWDCLETVTLSDYVTSIGESAFYGCTSIRSFVIPNGVTDIAERAFMVCTNLESISIPSSVTSIGEMAFYNIDKLTAVTIPANVASIGKNAFYASTGLETVVVLSKNAEYSTAVFPSSVTTVYGYAGSTTEAYCSANSLTFRSVVQVFYDGSGATGNVPETDVVNAGESMILPSAEGMTKTGFDFMGWSDGTTDYEAGESYTPTADTTFTAVWMEHLDENTDHVCDRGCGKTDMGEHSDSLTDNDHVCDYGCNEVLEDCSGGTATCTARATCSVCGEQYGKLDRHSFDSNGVCEDCGAYETNYKITSGKVFIELSPEHKLSIYRDGFTVDTVTELGIIFGEFEEIAYDNAVYTLSGSTACIISFYAATYGQVHGDETFTYTQTTYNAIFHQLEVAVIDVGNAIAITPNTELKAEVYGITSLAAMPAEGAVYVTPYPIDVVSVENGSYERESHSAIFYLYEKSALVFKIQNYSYYSDPTLGWYHVYKKRTTTVATRNSSREAPSCYYYEYTKNTAIDHDVLDDATCVRGVLCTVCGVVLEPDADPNKHAFTEMVEDAAHCKADATSCVSGALYWYDCAYCDAISDTLYFEGDPLDVHVIGNDGFCALCGAALEEPYYNASRDMDGNGTPDGAYEITKAVHLYWLAMQHDIDRHVILLDDIVINENVLLADGSLNEAAVSGFRHWFPICGIAEGVIFDGNGRSIGGVYYNDYEWVFGDEWWIGRGIFMENNGLIQNLTVKDSYIESEAVAGIVGGNYGTVSNCHSVNNTLVSTLDGSGIATVNEYGAVIKGCTNSSRIFIIPDGDKAYNVTCGGIVEMNNGTVEGCLNTGDITVEVICLEDTEVYVGGVVALSEQHDSYEVIVTDCRNEGNISVFAESKDEYELYACFIGGVIGDVYGSVNVRLTNTGDIEIDISSMSYVGGVVGALNGAALTDSHNEGAIRLLSSSYDTIGGVVGLSDYSQVENSYNTGEITAHSANGPFAIGGVVYYCYGSMIANCYNAGNITVGIDESLASDELQAYVSGIAVVDETLIVNCYNSGSITIEAYPGLSLSYGVVLVEEDKALVENCYYLNAVSTEDGGRTAEQFANGEVAYLLAKDFTVGEGEEQISVDGDVWGQLIGTDAHPVLNSDDKIYALSHCEGNATLYTNNPNKVYTLMKTDAVTATCLVRGNSAYWTCLVCGKHYSDEACAQETTLQAVDLGYADHSFGTAWDYRAVEGHAHVCTVSGCNAHDEIQSHNPNIPAATEDEAQICEDCGYQMASALGHTHSPATSWTSNATHHWKACSGCPAHLDEAPHSYDANNACDADCNVCGYERSVAHDFTGAWQNDADGHWHACANGCGAPDTKAAHVSAGAATVTDPEVCSICAWRIAPALGHTTHTPEAEWQRNETYHWHECTGCEGQELDKAAHSFGDWTVTEPAEVGRVGEKERLCTVCGEKQTQEIPALTPPTGDGSEADPPTGDGSEADPPTGDGSEADPPTGDGSEADPPTGDGSEADPPVDSGSEADPPADGGSEADPPTGDGSEADPPTDSGSEADPPADGGSEADPPADGGSEADPPADGGSEADPPSDSEPTESTPAGEAPSGDDPLPSEGLGVGAIVAIVAGSVALLGGAAGALWWFLGKRKR